MEVRFSYSMILVVRVCLTNNTCMDIRKHSCVLPDNFNVLVMMFYSSTNSNPNEHDILALCSRNDIFYIGTHVLP